MSPVRTGTTGAVGVIVVAAGAGTRLGADVPKALVPLAGRTILEHALAPLLPPEHHDGAHHPVGAVVVVVPAEHRDDVAGRVAATYAGPVEVAVVAGGADRSASVAAGLRALPGAVDRVLVHDAARCLTPVAVFERVVAALDAGDVAVVPGLPVTDTVKQVDPDGLVSGTPDRAGLVAVQTPQGFVRAVLEQAHAGGGSATDDAGLVEALGHPVRVVAGDVLAMKVTTPHDLAVAEMLLR